MEKLKAMGSAQAALDYYMRNRSRIAQAEFFDIYFRLAKTQTADFFSDICEWYTKTHVLPYLRDEHSKTISTLREQKKYEIKFIEDNLVSGCTLVDVGCGAGRIPLYLAKNQNIKKIYGIDLSHQMIEKANQLKKQLYIGDKVHFMENDITKMIKMPFDPPVIVTCMYGTLGCIPREADRAKTVENMLLNAHKGKVLISVFNKKRVSDARRYYYDEIPFLTGKDFTEIESEDGQKTFFMSPTTGYFTTWYTRDGILSELKEVTDNISIKEAGREWHIALC